MRFTFGLPLLCTQNICSSIPCLGDSSLFRCCPDVFAKIETSSRKRCCRAVTWARLLRENVGKFFLNEPSFYLFIWNALILEFNDLFEVFNYSKNCEVNDGHYFLKPEFASLLKLLGFSNIFKQCCVEFVCNKIKEEVKKQDFPDLWGTLRWLDDKVLPFTNTLLKTSVEKSIWGLNTHFEFYTLDAYSAIHIDRIFDIVTDLPESAMKLKMINISVRRTQQKTRLMLTLCDVLKDRLLHAGASTSQILYIYISCLQAMSVLQGNKYSFETVKQPIVDYLQIRSDTVRCIVDLLTSNERISAYSGELYSIGLMRMPKFPTHLFGNSPSLKGVECLETCDILEEMIHIYGSKELLVKEYSNIIAKKLLLCSSYDINAEVHQLELLKLRFGDSIMRSCAIMLNDVVESKRVHQTLCDMYFQDTLKGIGSFDVIIISGKFWPSMTLDLSFSLHPTLERYFKIF